MIDAVIATSVGKVPGATIAVVAKVPVLFVITGLKMKLTVPEELLNVISTPAIGVILLQVTVPVI